MGLLCDQTYIRFSTRLRYRNAEYRFKVSDRLREDFDNGESTMSMRNSGRHIPTGDRELMPNREHLNGIWPRKFKD